MALGKAVVGQLQTVGIKNFHSIFFIFKLNLNELDVKSDIKCGSKKGGELFFQSHEWKKILVLLVIL